MRPVEGIGSLWADESSGYLLDQAVRSETRGPRCATPSHRRLLLLHSSVLSARPRRMA